MSKNESTAAITNREREIIILTSKGLTNTEIAETLHISRETVITHKKNVRGKLSCKNCPELIAKAFHLGIIS